jgi:isopenicillin N synthase-like dioxygenase
MALNIPSIDMSAGLDHPDVIAQLGRACEQWGFFHLHGHGVSPALRQELFQGMQDFFALPTAEKRALSRDDSNFWGYYDKELTKNKVDRKEIFDIDANLDNLDAEPGQSSAAAVPWPPVQPELRPLVRRWLQECETLSQALLGSICEALEAAPESLNPFFLKDHSSFLRFNYYPPATTATSAPGDLGIHPHTDAGALTVLVQDAISGLQVRKGDTWYTVEPFPDSFIINIGDMLQVWSNDRFIAPEHRVLASGAQPRFSAPYFYNPSYETICAPLVTQGSASRYRPIRWGEFRFGRAAGDYADLGEEIQISHYRVQDGRV